MYDEGFEARQSFWMSGSRTDCYLTQSYAQGQISQHNPYSFLLFISTTVFVTLLPLINRPNMRPYEGNANWKKIMALWSIIVSM